MNTRASVVRIRDPEKFEPSFLDAGFPLLVERGATQMPAYKLWDDAYLRHVLKDAPLVVRFPEGARAKIAADTFFDYLADPGSYTLSRGAMYLTDFYLKPSFNEEWRHRLAASVPFPFPRDREYAEWISVYAGPAGTFSEFHQDIFSTFTWLALLRGRKRWRLAPPDMPNPASAASLSIDIVQESGDLIVLPPDWWHEVYNLSATLAVSGNFCTFEHARASRAAARTSDSPNREVWLHTWEAILRDQGGDI